MPDFLSGMAGSIPNLVDLLSAISHWPLSVAISTDYFWFPFFESIHVIAICLVVGSIFIVDLRLLGITSTKRPVTALANEILPWTWGAFVVAIIAGSMMFISKAPNYVADDYFRVKMLLILLAGINMAVFHLFTYRTVHQWDRDVPTVLGAKIAGAISLVLWIGVVFCGRWIGFTVI
jgi:hypothetical protein